METLTVQMFGGLRLSRDGVEMPAFPTRKSAALFSSLVLRRNDSLHREALCARLWSDQPERKARKSLRTALWRVRRVLEPDGCGESYLRIDSHRVAFRPNVQTSVDVWTFDDVAASVDAQHGDQLSEQGVRSIERATRSYSGHLLEGEPFIDEWTIAESERLTLLQISMLERLMLHHRVTENWSAAAATGIAILRLDNCREQVHREIMACYVAMGDRPAAVRQFGVCSSTLARELNIDPMRETVELHDRIRAGALRTRVLHIDQRPAPIGAAW